MSRFIQLHLLTSYPPSNLNRDDLGRPKTAIMGGIPRLRISSQSLKRAWRTSDIFENALSQHIGTRTKAKGVEVYHSLIEKGGSKKLALESAKAIADVFGKLKTLNKKEKTDLKNLSEQDALKKELVEVEIEQLAHISPEENRAIEELIIQIIEKKIKPEKEELGLLKEQHTAADIALFGRMLASSPKYNTEAAAQVAHAITVHPVVVEDDFFTAVDDLNSDEEAMGAGHMGDTEFAAGLFYLYICIDKQLLIDNLSGDEALVNTTIASLIEAVTTVSPTGKQNSFASRARASYILCEIGDQQPRSLSVAYLEPVKGGNMLEQAVKILEEKMTNMDKVYGDCADNRCSMNAETGKGSLQKIIDCAISA
jgi:CRISPR system Cascade subunit CasC